MKKILFHDIWEDDIVADEEDWDKKVEDGDADAKDAAIMRGFEEA